jgi:hypothetical protein
VFPACCVLLLAAKVLLLPPYSTSSLHITPLLVFESSNNFKPQCLTSISSPSISAQ